ncbi:haloacid dehalogenase-like hydrolase domain-containing 5 [Mizuhopecten yessoensis]|uniref:Haloacid dehalogenase-like hydrolase domain-containing 5 n=2 Tax=Mizuhopecten yessoensis TaxID=6573 RepID=A0A210PZT3_MIZYE|nr:haloacid dehalogenase-like hydrolase domain-containing 5 [Mizuhopecten yessoensis]OWF41986.1 Cat eye syndrome critical region protein 5-like [Mizuhopecten yessoensis]
MAFSTTTRRNLFKCMCRTTNRKTLTTQTDMLKFGFMFDIDGVIVRGKKLLPYVKEAFQLLTDRYGNFRVPAVFVTNAGNTLRQDKAEQLSEWLDVKVSSDQVVMSHSPLRMFPEFHDKHVLVSGQGPVVEIAQNLGFSKITTIDQIRQVFPNLDMVDHKRRRSSPREEDMRLFPPVEAVILFGEPVRWETNLQIIIDVLLTNGKPMFAPREIPYPHLPVLACNMDLLWMAEACMPRFGHGCFLTCLEHLYMKITGRELKYTGLIGKPSGITYHHADSILWHQAKSLGIHQLDTLYCIGDNPETDIYGANLYNRYIERRQEEQRLKVKVKNTAGGVAHLQDMDTDDDMEGLVHYSEDSETGRHFARNCHSILVCTGVYCSSRDYVTYDSSQLSNHNHRDFVLDPELKQPKIVTANVHEAVKFVLQKEGLS